MSADLLPRLLLAKSWTCNPKPDGAPADTESWDSPDGERHYWAFKADACVQDWQSDARFLALQNAAIFALGLKTRAVIELGRRLGLLESAEMALGRAAAIRAAKPTTPGYATAAAAETDETRATALDSLAALLVHDAGLTLEAWLATREEAPRG